MNNEKKDAMIASIETVEAIEEFLKDWWSVSELYETSAKAVSKLVRIAQKDASFMTVELRDYIEQHMMMINLLKGIAEKGGSYGK